MEIFQLYLKDYKKIPNGQSADTKMFCLNVFRMFKDHFLKIRDKSRQFGQSQAKILEMSR